MKPLLTAGGLAAALLTLGACGTSSPTPVPKSQIMTFTSSEVGEDLVNLIPTKFGGVTVMGMPACDSPLMAVGDISLCSARLKDYMSNFDTVQHTISVTLADKNGHVRVRVQD